MIFDYLKSHNQELLQHMVEHGYSESYIHTHEAVINFILTNADKNEWQSYEEVYNVYYLKGITKRVSTIYASILGTLKQFETDHIFPVHGHRHSIMKKGKYDFLVDDFKTLIDNYEQEHRKKGNKDSTISSVCKIGVSFLFTMQERGCMTISSIKEKDVLSYFQTDDGKLRCGSATSNYLQRIFLSGLWWKHDECLTVFTYLPKIPKSKKNIQYLEEDEITKLREALDSQKSTLSLRDRAVCMTLLFTGLRRGDVADLKLNDIGWETDTIKICQKKTEMPITIPLLPVLGNTIYDYIKNERPNVDDAHLFLSTRYSTPGSPITGSTVSSIVRKVFNEAAIRQNSGDKKNPHLFRHHMVVTMLGNSVPQPVISQTLGHSSPSSIESYLSADFVHLKECALSIEDFPVPKEVFES
ncbi:MAG: tyrosine-type recombinase/integrase [Peptostreptococcaceae bacterium]|nr:tyrosine-type recombinase/integrase [Peptostreptococcaceae bacterium]